MLISAIVLIVVRLFSVYWLVEGLEMLAMGFAMVVGNSKFGEEVREFIPGIIMLISSVVGWVIAPCLSRAIAGKHNGPVSISGLTLKDLYAFAFVFLGLYFILESVGQIGYWLYYAVFMTSDSDLAKKLTYSGLVRPVIVLITGSVCLVSRQRWAGKLAAPEKDD